MREGGNHNPRVHISPVPDYRVVKYISFSRTFNIYWRSSFKQLWHCLSFAFIKVYYRAFLEFIIHSLLHYLVYYYSAVSIVRNFARNKEM